MSLVKLPEISKNSTKVFNSILGLSENKKEIFPRCTENWNKKISYPC
jgi:hypothetical protein